MNQPQDEQNFKNRVRQFIAANKIPKAIALMKETAEQYRDKESVNSIVLTERRMQEIKKFEIRGMMTLTESFREQAIVVDSLLSILDGMEFQKEETGNVEIPVQGTTMGKNVILFLASAPRKLARLQLEKEFVRISSGMQDSKAYELIAEWTVSPLSLQKAILRHKPKIIHFAGHGIDKPDAKGIYLQDTSGEEKLVAGEALGSLFRVAKSKVSTELVLLNACDTQPTIRAIHEHVPHVIGMGQKISDSASIEFATGFYNALAMEEDYHFAFKFAKNLIELEGLTGSDVPIMLS